MRRRSRRNIPSESMMRRITAFNLRLDGLTFKEVGRCLGVSKERARQLRDEGRRESFPEHGVYDQHTAGLIVGVALLGITIDDLPSNRECNQRILHIAEDFRSALDSIQWEPQS